MLEKMKLDLHLDEEFVSYQSKKVKGKTLISVKTNHQSYLTRNLIITIPPKQLNKLKLFPARLVNSVFGVPLCRMFAIYPADNFWYQDIDATYTNENVQRIYLKGTRLVQIAYSSAGKAEFWNELSRDTMAQKVELQKELKRMFPNKEIGHPELLKTHFWEAGVHIWKIKKEGSDITKKYSTNPNYQYI